MLRAYRRITNTNLIVFGLTRLGIAHTIYRTRGEQANHYIPHTVKKVNVVNGVVDVDVDVEVDV
jgi:hypothetical protein